MIALGMDPYTVLHTDDPIERTIQFGILKQVAKERERLDKNLAAYIQEGISKLFGGR